jgi:hypothetical protein
MQCGVLAFGRGSAGCDYVLGVDGRQMHVDRANFVFEVEGIEKDRCDVDEVDVFALALRESGHFDIVLCLSLRYHINKNMNRTENLSEVNDDVLLMDTALATLTGLYFSVQRGDHLDEPKGALDHKLVMIPTWEAVREPRSEFEY